MSRVNDPLNSLVVSVGKVSAGTQFNIITDTAVMEGTVRCYAKETRAMVEETMRRIVTDIAAAEGCTAELEYSYLEPSVVKRGSGAHRDRQGGCGKALRTGCMGRGEEGRRK